ncbi:MAG TPA: alanine racemase [Thermoanaerobaculia bacterium]|nr:alanine racemase [Thermoanaerobaculia bacterium]
MSTPPETRLTEMRSTIAQIDLRAFDRNVEAIASRLPGGTKLIALLKADGYGHGALELARRCGPEQVAMVGVALLEEALELRRGGVTLPILVLGALSEAQVRIALEHDITLGVPGPESLEQAARVARERDLAIHLKLDSGMGRMGSVESELPRVVELLRSAPRLRVDAIYTHFANAGDPADPLTDQQLANFDRMVAALAAEGVRAPRHHVSNSAGTMRGIMHGDYVRTGIALFGAAPLDTEPTRLEPLMRWSTRIVRLKELPPDHPIGYGATFHTKRASRIATLPLGYADGYHRALSTRGEVLVRGRRAPVVGRVSMDLVTIDVTDVADAQLGDEVVLLGRQGSEEIAAEELAAKLDTISYEVFCSVSARVPRVYVDGQSIVRIRTRFDE